MGLHFSDAGTDLLKYLEQTNETTLGEQKTWELRKRRGLT